MDESLLPQVTKPLTESSLPSFDANEMTCDLSSALGADDTIGTWKPLAPTPQERELTDDLQAVIAMRVTYRGEPFCGFAKQPGQLTVQGSLEEALSKVFRHPVETVCAGRTDSGVHARGQWVSFSLTAKEWNERSDYKVLKSLNALTHADISVREIMRKDLDFSARFSARSREYRYFICTDKAAPLLMRDFSWHLGKELDLKAMRKAAKYLIGEHDFRSFCMAASAEGKTTNRNVVSIDIDEMEMWGEKLVVITVIGNAFLHSMVRTIVGTLVLVGRGKREPEWVSEVLAACDRTAAGENAPAQGLVFWQVNYDGELIYDPEAKKQEARAKELAEAEAKAKAEKKFHLFNNARFGSSAEFEIPRGVPRAEGQLPFSGASMSDIKTKKGDTDSFDLADVDGLRNPTNVSRESETQKVATKVVPAQANVPHKTTVTRSIQTPAAAYAETGAYGELEWDLDLEESKDSSSEHAKQEQAVEIQATEERAHEAQLKETQAEPNSTKGKLERSLEPEQKFDFASSELAIAEPDEQATAGEDELAAVGESEQSAAEEKPLKAKHAYKAAESKPKQSRPKHTTPAHELTAPMPVVDPNVRYPFETRPLPYQLND